MFPFPAPPTVTHFYLLLGLIASHTFMIAPQDDAVIAASRQLHLRLPVPPGRRLTAWPAPIPPVEAGCLAPDTDPERRCLLRDTPVPIASPGDSE
jgi:hypothetical protein